MSADRFHNPFVVLGDSLTYMGPGYKLDDQNWVSVLEYAMAGYATSAVVSVNAATSTVTVSPGTGVFFQPNTTFRLKPAGLPYPASRFLRKAGGYTVTAQSGDTLTISPAPSASTATGTVVYGTGGGAAVVGMNVGHSGDTTAQMLSRAALMFDLETPALAFVMGGTNDLNSQGSTLVTAGSTTTAVNVTHATAAALSCPGSVLIINGSAGHVVSSVTLGGGSASDVITLTTPLSVAPTTGQTVQCDTAGNLTAIGALLLTAGVPRVIMLGRSGCNWATGGDFPTATSGLSSQLTATQTAATALAVPFVSIYTFQLARVSAGVDSGTSNSYQYLPSNTHPSVYGDQVFAMAAMAGVMSQSGWLASMMT